MATASGGAVVKIRMSENPETAVFTTDQIRRFLCEDSLDYERFWLVRKAYVIVAIHGKLKPSEAQDLTFENVTEKDDGFHVEHVENGWRFLIPRSPPGKEVCYATILSKYRDAVFNDLRKMAGYFFLSANKVL